ncbi:hypothetical protein ABH917_004226 [Thermobifida halotolerans]
MDRTDGTVEEPARDAGGLTDTVTGPDGNVPELIQDR